MTGPAPAATTSSRLAWWVVAGGAAAVVVGQGFGRFSYGLLLPAMTRDVIGSYSLAGTIGTLNLGAYLVGMVAITLMATRIQPVRLVIVGLIGTLAGMLLLGIARGLPMVYAGMIVSGLCCAGVWVPVTAIVSSLMPARLRGIALGLVVVGPGIGVLLAGQLSSLVQAVVGPDAWREVWLLQVAIGTAMLAFIVPVLRRAPAIHVEAGSFGLGALRRIPRWWAPTTTYAAFGLGYALYLTYLVAALEHDAGFAPQAASTMYSLVGFASLAGGLALGGVSDRFGRRRTLLVVMGVLVVCSLTVLTGRQPWVALSAVTFGALMSGTGAVMGALISDDLQGSAVASAFGMLTTIFAVMQMLSPQLGGWLAELSGSFVPTFVVAAVAFTVATATAYLIPSSRSAD